VAIVGGGPGGSTCASLLKKYNPSLSVLVLEKEKFPRDHVGESQLPSISAILNEMGCWDAVEAANFPIKLGASLTWGKTTVPWDFDFMPPEDFVDQPRPARYEGQRRRTAFQVDRAIYDDILLRHAEQLGAVVREGTLVRDVSVSGERVHGLGLETGEQVRARWYVDASGTVGVVRRALSIEVDCPTELRNIAIWDYWENTDWAFKIGVGGTRILVRSLPFGWIWFIPLGPTRTSIGLVCPAEYYRRSAKDPATLYRDALAMQEEIAALTSNATCTGRVRTCKDWSQVAHRTAGPNWILAGEAAGFADPILSAGLALTHAMAREAAYTILEHDRGELDRAWLLSRYDERSRLSIRQHIRFAQYWYSANGVFTDLHDQCQAIAREAGLRLTPLQAWRWLAQGGFTNFDIHNLQLGSFDVFSTRLLIEKFTGRDAPAAIETYNDFRVNLHGATPTFVGELRDGRIRQVPCHVKGDSTLPITFPFQGVIALLEKTSDCLEFVDLLRATIRREFRPELHNAVFHQHLQAMEAMIHEGWIIARINKRRGHFKIDRKAAKQLRDTAEGRVAVQEARRARTAGSQATPA